MSDPTSILSAELETTRVKSADVLRRLRDASDVNTVRYLRAELLHLNEQEVFLLEQLDALDLATVTDWLSVGTSV